MSSVLSLPLSLLGGGQIVASPGQSGRESSSCMRPDSWPRLLSGAEKALTPDLWQAHCWYPSLQADPVYNLQVPHFTPRWALDWLARPSPTAQQVTDLPALLSMPRRDTEHLTAAAYFVPIPQLAQAKQPSPRLRHWRVAGAEPDKVCLWGETSHSNNRHG